MVGIIEKGRELFTDSGNKFKPIGTYLEFKDGMHLLTDVNESKDILNFIVHKFYWH